MFIEVQIKPTKDLIGHGSTEVGSRFFSPESLSIQAESPSGNTSN
ncbi:hypothetical protein [Thermococcus celericrescens]|nr:hypothetical protein [Thermococcus celericrescens]